MRIRLVVATLVAIAALGLATYDRPLTGNDYERAAAAALSHVGGGTVTESEIGDLGAGREVEVRLGDGSQVEVRLDQAFRVIGTDADDDGPGVEDDGDD